MTSHIVADNTPRPLTCATHPEREAGGTIDGLGVCADCVEAALERYRQRTEAELRRYRLWFASFAVVQGGVEALRP